MLEASQLVSTIEALGIRLRLVDGRVRMTGDRDAMAALTPELRAAFHENLPACVDYLGERSRELSVDAGFERGPAHLAPHLRDFWQQILRGEHDAGFTNCTQRVVDVRGSVDLRLLRAAADDVVASHPILGCTLYGPERDWLIEIPQRSDAAFFTRAIPGTDAEQLRAEVYDLTWKPLRLEHCLHRFFVFSNDRDHHVIGFVLHHFVADQSSVAIAWNLLWHRYLAHSVGVGRSLPRSERLAIAALADPRDLHSSPAFARERNFWSHRPAAIKDSAIVDVACTELRGDAAFHVVRPIVVNSNAIPALIRLGRELRTGMLPILLAAQAIALWRQNRQRELGTLLLERGRYAAPESEAIGNFARIVPLATHAEAGDDLARVAARVHAERLAVLATRPYPYEGIARLRWASRAPTLPLVNYQARSASTARQESRDNSLVLTPFELGPAPLVPCRTHEFEAHYLHLSFDGAELTGFLRYSPQKVGREAADAFLEDFVTILESEASRGSREALK